MVKKLTTADFSVVEGIETAVVDFSATWCGPCKMLAPVLEEVSDEMSDVSFFNVDVDESAELARKFGVMSVPTVVVLKKGEKAGKKVGFMPKDELVGFINSSK